MGDKHFISDSSYILPSSTINKHNNNIAGSDNGRNVESTSSSSVSLVSSSALIYPTHAPIEWTHRGRLVSFQVLFSQHISSLFLWNITFYFIFRCFNYLYVLLGNRQNFLDICYDVTQFCGKMSGSGKVENRAGSKGGRHSDFNLCHS